MPIEEIKKVCVIGGGTMGLQISLVSAIHGYQVAVYDVSPDVIKNAPERHRQMLDTVTLGDEANKISGEEALALLTYTTDSAEAAEGADITSESVPEQIFIKKETHAQFEKLCGPGTILTTNTSSLRVSDIEPALDHPEKFVAMHFHSGLSPLVDIMKGTKASDSTVEVVYRFVKSIGLVPIIMKKEWGGYVYNTMLIMWYLGGLLTVSNGVATPEEVDRSWMLVTGSNHGPFGSMDHVGLDVVYGAGEKNDRGTSLFSVFGNVTDVLKPYVERGELGVKTGKGIYTYPDPAFTQPGFLTGDQ